MKFVVENPAVNPKEIDRAINEMANDPHRDDFRDISELMIRTGLEEKGAKEKLFNKVSECVMKEITNGVVQLTIQELEGERIVKANFEKKLPEFYPRIDVVVKSGAIDIETLTNWFKVTSRINLNNLGVRMDKKNNEITGFNSGTLQASVTLAFCGPDRENKSPFTLFKDKELVKLDLAKAVKFVEPDAS